MLIIFCLHNFFSGVNIYEIFHMQYEVQYAFEGHMAYIPTGS